MRRSRGVVVLSNKENKNINNKIMKILESVASFKEELLDIIEVSNIKTSKITKKKQHADSKTKAKPGANFKTPWIKRLIIPYERSVMGITQVKKETVFMFEKLCNFIDHELKIDKSSLNKKVIEVAKKEGYYNNILYTIYCIAESHVTKAYSGDFDYYNSDFSYDILQSHLGLDLQYKVYEKATYLEENVEPPNEETLEYFKLTGNGLAVKWWDQDGDFRSEKAFSKEDVSILDSTPLRRTKVWESYSVKKEIINLYLKFWGVIFENLEDDLKWDRDNKEIIESLRKGKYKFFMDYQDGGLLSSLLKLSENTVREVIPSMQVLNVKKQIDTIEKSLPSKVVDEINNEVTDYKENITNERLKDIINDMIKEDSKNWKLKVAKIVMTDKESKIDRLIDFRDDREFIKIAKNIVSEVKKENNEDLILICLYGIEVKEKLNQKNTKTVEKIIHPSNLSEYEKIVKSKEELSRDLLDKLIVLKEPIRKRIDLDMDKVQSSKEELGATIDIISSYIDNVEEESDNNIESSLKQDRLDNNNSENNLTAKDVEREIVKEEIIQKDDTKDEIASKEDGRKINLKYIDFLQLLLDRKVISLEEGKDIAIKNGTLFNVFLRDVNQELYEYVGDQTVLIENDDIKIDDFYIDIVKELLVG